MKTKIQISKPEEVHISVTLSSTFAEWETLNKELLDLDVPYHCRIDRLRDEIQGMLTNIRQPLYMVGTRLDISND